ncbi:MAG: site-specific integrase [Pseudoclavibacter sp.]
MSTARTASRASRREAWGSLPKLSSGRWQARYPGPDGEVYTARTEDDQALTFHTKTDARTWLAAVHAKIALGEWEPPAVVVARCRVEEEAERARTVGFAEYAERWMTMVRTRPNRSGRMRSAGTIRTYQGKVTGYLIPEFGDTPIRQIDADRIRLMTERLDRIPSPLNPDSNSNGITRPVLIVLMMILRQAVRDQLILALPDVPVPGQKPVRRDADHDPEADVATPVQVEALYEAAPKQWSIMVLLAAWCQLRRGECLGLQRRDIEWHEDGSATLHVRRQLNVNTGDYTEPKSDAGRRSLSVPKFMVERLKAHLRDFVAPGVKAPVIPGSPRSSMPLSNTHWGYVWGEVRDGVPSLPSGFRFHDLRHTGLTIFAQEGATLAELMRRGGHADIRLVLRYQHATMKRDRELADRMSDHAAARIVAAKNAAKRSSPDSDGHL